MSDLWLCVWLTIITCYSLVIVKSIVLINAVVNYGPVYGQMSYDGIFYPPLFRYAHIGNISKYLVTSAIIIFYS